MPNAFAGFPKEMVSFFRGLKRNNRREWFQPRKDVFDLHVKGPMIELVEALNREFAKFAPHYITDSKRAIFASIVTHDSVPTRRPIRHTLRRHLDGVAAIRWP